MGGELILAVVGGVVLPTVMLMVKRHYEANPNKWESILIGGCLGAGAMVFGLWLLKQVEGDGIGNFLVGIFGFWIIFAGLMAFVIYGLEAVEAIRETRDK